MQCQICQHRAFWGSLLWVLLAPSRCPADANSGAENAIGQNSFGGLSKRFYRLGLGSTSLGGRHTPDGDASTGRSRTRCIRCHRGHPFGSAKEIVAAQGAHDGKRGKMRLRTLFPTALIAALAVLTSTGPAWAKFDSVPLPGPGGTFGLAALGIAGAILLARRRK